MNFIILTPEEHTIASQERTVPGIGKVQVTGIETIDGNFALDASLLNLPEHQNHLSQFSNLPLVETFEPLYPPPLPKPEMNLSLFRDSLVNYFPFLRVTANFHPIVGAGMVSEFYKPDPYFVRIVSMWNGSIIPNSLDASETEHLNNLAIECHVPIRWLENSSIELVEG